jgi:hypothetical protein
MHQSDMVESVVAYCREPSRVCPLPPKWNPALGELLPNRVVLRDTTRQQS